MTASSVSVAYPTLGVTDGVITKLEVTQEEYAHDIAVYRVAVGSPGRPQFRAGTPVSITWARGRDQATFHGYVHHVETDGVAGKRGVMVWCRGASDRFNNGFQATYYRRTVPSIAGEICRLLNFDSDIVPHGRIFEGLTAPGGRTWEFLVKYAKEIGYSLYAKNTRILLHPRTHNTARYAGQAPILHLPDEGERGTLFEFDPVDGAERPGRFRHDSTITGYDYRTGGRFSVTGGVAPPQLGRKSYTANGRTYFNDIANTPDEARWMLLAGSENRRFNLSATAVAEGFPRVHQTWPVLLSGVDSAYAGLWFVKKATHRIVADEYTMKLELRRDGLGSTVTVPDARARRVVATRSNPEGRPKDVYPPSVLRNGQWTAQWSASSRPAGRG